VLVRAIQSEESFEPLDHLDSPITEHELLAAMKCALNKATGYDGLSLEFYKPNWKLIGSDLLELLNYMFLHQKVTPAQKHRVIICIPKTTSASSHADYCPITLLTTEYKLLARLQPLLQERLRRLIMHYTNTELIFSKVKH
jgi:hypothetical protein